MKILKKEILLLLLLIAAAFTFRWFLIKNNYFSFYFDQARDAYLSRQIIEQKDIKIQGPSASGTNNILYHGVLYYYLIGPIYTAFHGNPVPVTLFLNLVNSLSLIPIFLLAKLIFNQSSVGYLAAFLYAFSLDAAESGSFLSNPSLASFTIPWLYLFLYLVCIKNQRQYLPLIALALGLTNQVALWTLYLIIPTLLLLLYQVYKTKHFKFTAKQLILSSLTYLLTISSIIVAQWRLYQANIFTLSAIKEQWQNNLSRVAQLTMVIHPYFEKISYAISPSWPKISLAIFLLIGGYFYWKNRQSKTTVIFFSIWFFGPLLIAMRNFYYMLTGILPIVYLIIAWVIKDFSKRQSGRILIGTFLILYTTLNLLGIEKTRAKEYTHVANIQKGAFLHHQLALIDKTYQLAKGQQFSISSLTSPYKYNTTWSYLYDWYGQENYGYKPFWFGPDQQGLPAGDLLEKINQPEKIHFSIYEPDPGWVYMFIPEFNQEQTSRAGPVKNKFEFGNLKLEERTLDIF